MGTNDLNLVTEILDGRTGTRVAMGNPDRQDFIGGPAMVGWPLGYLGRGRVFQ